MLIYRFIYRNLHYSEDFYLITPLYNFNRLC
ncbi:hypothetical protein GGP64_003213 [Salinibacter ruber]|nr:hypothetical protein [Salinibacter ruber]